METLKFKLPNQKTIQSAQLKAVEKAAIDKHDKIWLRKNFSDVSKNKFYIVENETIEPNSSTNQKIEIIAIRQSEKQEKQLYLETIDALKKEMHSKKIKKVVFSRKVNFLIDWNTQNKRQFFQMLCDHFQSAFVYCYESKDETWIGATPETFFKINNQSFQTVSLAGTRLNKNQKIDSSWTEKEKIEQKLVTDYIEKKLLQLNFENLIIENPINHLAGNLIHLKSTITATVPEIFSLNKIVNSFHPTPAVGGLPKKKSLALIKNHEKHQRGWYSGVMGFIENKNCNLFVNLRCLQITKNNTYIYAGGGITHDSIPENEWHETENKMKSLTQFFKVKNEV